MPHKKDTENSLETLSGMNPEYETMIEMVPKLLDVGFLSLLNERLDYANQMEIKKDRVWLMAACAVYYNLDFGLVLCFLSGEYTVEWRDVDAIMSAIDKHVSADDNTHLANFDKGLSS